mmetsp:Transcript_43324/g.80547  ORF Transcript_43324/g.80547 Transcript_43324/m.80547 type:complete len:285 (-) Transcript_43324:421-1275(-)
MPDRRHVQGRHEERGRPSGRRRQGHARPGRQVRQERTHPAIRRLPRLRGSRIGRGRQRLRRLPPSVLRGEVPDGRPGRFLRDRRSPRRVGVSGRRDRYRRSRRRHGVRRRGRYRHRVRRRGRGAGRRVRPGQHGVRRHRRRQAAPRRRPGARGAAAQAPRAVGQAGDQPAPRRPPHGTVRLRQDGHGPGRRGRDRRVLLRHQRPRGHLQEGWRVRDELTPRLRGRRGERRGLRRSHHLHRRGRLHCSQEGEGGGRGRETHRLSAPDAHGWTQADVEGRCHRRHQ